MTSVNPEIHAPSRLASAFSEVVRARRSIYAYRDQPVPRQPIEQALADAVLAPNHHRTAPWRFFVVAREARDRLVTAYEAAARRIGREVVRAGQRAREAPINVIVGCVPNTDNPRVVVREEEFATMAAVQTFMLSLAAQGIGSLLTTGELAESPEVARLVGLEAPSSRLIGVVNVGYRNPERPVPPRAEPLLASVMTWIS